VARPFVRWSTRSQGTARGWRLDERRFPQPRRESPSLDGGAQVEFPGTTDDGAGKGTTPTVTVKWRIREDASAGARAANANGALQADGGRRGDMRRECRICLFVKSQNQAKMLQRGAGCFHQG
jgi:hypothetical protein